MQTATLVRNICCNKWVIYKWARFDALFSAQNRARVCKACKERKEILVFRDRFIKRCQVRRFVSSGEGNRHAYLEDGKNERAVGLWALGVKL